MKRINQSALLVTGATLVLLALGTYGMQRMPVFNADPADITHDGVVDASDLSLVLSHWSDKAAKTSEPITLKLSDKPDLTVGIVHDSYRFQPANATLQSTVYGEELQ